MTEVKIAVAINIETPRKLELNVLATAIDVNKPHSAQSIRNITSVRLKIE